LLSELKVSSFGIIGGITWAPCPGLNVITGETGAGKSLVIDALEALLDGKMSEADIRYGSDSARIEAVFSPAAGITARSIGDLISSKGLSSAADNLILSCEFRRQGRSVPRINGDAASRSLVQELGRLLVDIHGQSQHLSLYEPKNHLDYLDSFAGLDDDRQEFGRKVSELSGIEAALAQLIEKEKGSAQRQELLRYQITEIHTANPQPGEEEQLETRRQLLASAEKLKELGYETCRHLDGEESGGPAPLAEVNAALKALRRLAAVDASMNEQLRQLEDGLVALEETALNVRRYAENLDYRPRELEELEDRLRLIRDLKRKYGSSVTLVIQYAEQAEAELGAIDSLAEQKELLLGRLRSLKCEMGQLAADLSARRAGSALKLSRAVNQELAELDMQQVKFEARLRRSRLEGGLPFPDGEQYAFNRDGADSVDLMVSTNPGEPFKPLADIASTGEVSRFTLALKVALAGADRVPVLIFDEIDIGVGGRSGDMLGRKLWKLARRHQVICVTHLPQIACYADAHFNVSKQTAGERVESRMEVLHGEKRTGELAAMLGGSSVADITLTAAGEMLNQAEVWKKRPHVIAKP